MSSFLSEFITDQDKAFDVSRTTDPKKYKRGTLSDQEDRSLLGSD